MIAAVVKVGGSLSRGSGLAALGRELAQLGRQYPLLVVPGGGDFADAVRACDRRFGLDDSTAHWMAVLAMDQYGYLLATQIPDSVPVRGLAAARQIAKSGRLPVLLPFDLLRQADPLPHSWAVTSDSIAAWIARQAGTPLLVLLKDVDGLYPADPRTGDNPALLPVIPPPQLSRCHGVDPYLPSLLDGSGPTVWIINGAVPGRLATLLAGGQPPGTRVQPALP